MLEERVSIDVNADLHAEIHALRRGLLRTFAPTVLALGWVWFSYVVLLGWTLSASTFALIILVAAYYGVSRCREAYYRLACALLLAGLVGAQTVMLMAHPLSVAVFWAILTVVIANSLLDPLEALGVTILSCVLTTAARQFGAYRLGSSVDPADLVVLHFLALGIVWLATRPLRHSVEWAVTGWAHAHEALHETRQRRGEVYRALRALEEATYRIERMNNELVVAQREAEEARALKGRLAATISHELRGPLNLILGFSKLIALSPESYGMALPRPYRADIHTIYRNSLHLVALVDDILDLSQIEAQRLPLVKDRIDLETEVIGKVVESIRPLAERKGLYLHEELAGNLPWLLADPVRLRQALLNLLTNAIRFTERGGITVHSRQQGDQLLVSVQDTGPGIAQDQINQLFQEFHRLQRTSTREEGGSGLGLAISKHLIELHGGQIWVESNLGEGTTFHLAIPLPEHEVAAAGMVRTEESPLPSAPESCVIIHHDPAVVRLLARHIESYRVIGLPDEAEVAALADELHPRAVITTPEHAGSVWETLLRLPFDVPLITCPLPHLTEQSQLDGMMSYLTKPVVPEMVSVLMRRVETDEETTVLLVDDDPDAVRLLERILTALPRPYRILKAYDGEQALDLMRAQRPDIVFMDLVMPGLDGPGTVAQMRIDEHLCGVPVVIVSAVDWLEGSVGLGTPLEVRSRGPLELARGARCLQSLLDAFAPRYLPNVAP